MFEIKAHNSYLELINVQNGLVIGLGCHGPAINGRLESECITRIDLNEYSVLTIDTAQQIYAFESKVTHSIVIYNWQQDLYVTDINKDIKQGRGDISQFIKLSKELFKTGVLTKHFDVFEKTHLRINCFMSDPFSKLFIGDIGDAELIVIDDANCATVNGQEVEDTIQVNLTDNLSLIISDFGISLFDTTTYAEIKFSYDNYCTTGISNGFGLYDTTPLTFPFRRMVFDCVRVNCIELYFGDDDDDDDDDDDCYF